MCSLAHFNRFCTCRFFSTMVLYGGFLASIKRLLTVTVLIGHFRSSLIFPEVMIGWIFAYSDYSSIRFNSICSFSFTCFGLCCHFKKAFEIILAENPIICCTSLYVFPSPINFLIKLRCCSGQCLEWPILLNNSEGNMIYNYV